MTKSRGINGPKRQWLQHELQLLVELYSDVPAGDVAALLDTPLHRVYKKANRLGLTKSEAFYAGDMSARIHRGHHSEAMIANRFQKGQVPKNKGVKGISYPGMERTQFVKGARPKNWMPAGTIRLNSDGYVDIKIAEGMFKWRALHRENWKKEHGSYPPKGYVLGFKDGDKENCAVSNLELLTLKQNMLRNSLHTNFPPEVVEVIQLQAALNHRINHRLKQANPEDPNYVKKHRRPQKYLVRDAKRLERQKQSHGA